MNIQKYVRAQSLEEAYRLNQSKQNRILGGMLWLKMGTGTVNTAIDLCELGLDAIEETAEQFSIGAMVTLRQIELHEGLKAYTNGAVEAAVKDIVGVQFRNLATVGGSIWGRFGFSDVLTVFLSMDTYVELYKGGIIPLEQFAAMKYGTALQGGNDIHDNKDTLDGNDILVRLIVKKTPGRFVYSAMRNQRTDLPVITCALSQIEGEYRAVAGARPARAMVIRDDKGMLSPRLTDTSIKAFADYVAESAPTGSNTRGSAAYRTHLIRVLTQRNLSELRNMQELESKED